MKSFKEEKEKMDEEFKELARGMIGMWLFSTVIWLFGLGLLIAFTVFLVNSCVV